MAAQSSSGRPGRRRRAPAGGPVERSEPQPVDVDGVGAALAGTVAWTIALVAMLPFYGTLRDDGRDWWIWTCLAGVGLGLIGFEYCRRRRASLRDPAEEPPLIDEPGSADELASADASAHDPASPAASPETASPETASPETGTDEDDERHDDRESG